LYRTARTSQWGDLLPVDEVPESSKIDEATDVDVEGSGSDSDSEYSDAQSNLSDSERTEK
jgi:hypothetical protein